MGLADNLQDRLAKAEQERDELSSDLEHSINALAAVIVAMDERRAERDLARAELVSARQEIEQLRAAQGWIVARDGGRYCERCEQEVRRGEAYELQPGTGGLTAHIRCPDLPSPDNQIPPTEGQQ